LEGAGRLIESVTCGEQETKKMIAEKNIVLAICQLFKMNDETKKAD